MLVLYTSLIDDESEKLRFEEIYYSYHKRMYVVAKKILGNNEDAVKNYTDGAAYMIADAGEIELNGGN